MGLLKYFTYDHLKEPLRSLSKEFHRQAAYLIGALPEGSEKTVALRKLLEAKDAAVRSMAVDGKE